MMHWMPYRIDGIVGDPAAGKTAEGTERNLKAETKPFDNCFVAAKDVEKIVLEGSPPFLSGHRRYHEFFVNHVFFEMNARSPIQGVLAMDAFMINLSAIRVAMSGHVAAMFPLLRATLEASRYAFLVGESEDLQVTWLKRNSTPEALASSG